MMIRECNQLIRQKHMHMEWAKILYATKKKTYQYYKTIQTMINFDDVAKENIKEHNPNWPQVPVHPYRVFPAGTRCPGIVPWMFPKGSNVQDLEGTFKGFSVDQYRNCQLTEKKNVF